MEYYSSLRELLAHSPQSKRLFSTFSPDAQVALQEQKQSIHTFADLQKIAALFEDAPHWW